MRRNNTGAIQMCQIMLHLDNSLPEDTIFTNAARNFSVWLHQFHRYHRFGTQVAPCCGSMGCGMHAAAFARPQARVICIAGDGDFRMIGTELATAVAYGLRIRVPVLNNGMLATIRMHQERHLPGRVSGPDLAALISSPLQNPTVPLPSGSRARRTSPLSQIRAMLRGSLGLAAASLLTQGLRAESSVRILGQNLNDWQGWT